MLERDRKSILLRPQQIRNVVVVAEFAECETVFDDRFGSHQAYV